MSYRVSLRTDIDSRDAETLRRLVRTEMRRIDEWERPDSSWALDVARLAKALGVKA